MDACIHSNYLQYVCTYVEKGQETEEKEQERTLIFIKLKKNKRVASSYTFELSLMCVLNLQLLLI